MKKDYMKILYGFTIAEILISLAIAMIVATAMVPVFGTKKVKRPTNKIIHGIAACYYDAGGSLHYDYRENRAGAPTSGTAENGVCKFPIPKTSYLEVTAIGAGGNSTTNAATYNGTTDSEYAGSLRIDSNYQRDIDDSSSNDPSLPGKIRLALDTWASRNQGQLVAVYTNIISPKGAGGTGKCMQRTANGSCGAEQAARGGGGPNNSWYSARTGFNSSNTTSGCWWFQHGKGGNSGYSYRKPSMNLYIKGSSTITVETDLSKTRVSVKDNNNASEKYVQLDASGAGGNADCVNGATQCSDGANSNVNSTCHGDCSGASPYDVNAGASGGREYEFSRTCDDNTVAPKIGSVTYTGVGSTSNAWNGGAINWKYKRPIINATFATMGNYGNEVPQVFQNIKGTLELIPAKNNSQASVVKKDGIEILRANSAGNGKDMSLNGVYVNETFPEEITQKAVPENLSQFKYWDKVKGAGYSNFPLLNCAATQSCPGFAGTGKYFLFRSTRGLETLTLINRQNGAQYTHDFGQDITASDKDVDENIDNRRAVTCKGSDIRSTGQKINGVEVMSICTGRYRSGGRGGIIVIW